MLKLGLTGSIAAGKSTVLDGFARRGVPVFSSDAAVHELYRGAAVPVVAALFPDVVHNGEIDRTALARHVLGAPERLRALEQAVHPLVRQRIARFLAEAESTGAALAVVDIPLLYEGGADYGLDRVLVVAAEPETLRRRALARPGMTVEKLDAILARQLPQDEKLKRADHVIRTDGTLAETDAAVAALIATLTDGERA
jgi:dephospho-CoA kinase